MKKATTFFTMIALCMVLGACGKDNTENGTGSSVVEPIESSQQESSAASESSEEAESSVPAEGGEAGVTGEDGWSAEMETIKAAVVDALGENYWPQMAVPAEILEGTYGITSDMYDDYMAEMPMMMTNVDTLIVIKAKEGKAADVEAALTAYREMMVNDTMQYPMNLGKIQASRIEVIDNYVCFVQLGADTMNALEQGDDAVVKQCLEQNELAIEVIRNTVVK